jgi:hypothetical protein
MAGGGDPPSRSGPEDVELPLDLSKDEEADDAA